MGHPHAPTPYIEQGAPASMQDVDSDIPDANIRYMPAKPTGAPMGINLMDLVHVGAEAGARSLTTAQVTKIIHAMQTATMEANVRVFPVVAKALHDAATARIQEIVQRVRSLPQVQMPQLMPGWRGNITGQTYPTGPAYVQLDAVLALLAAAQVDQNR